MMDLSDAASAGLMGLGGGVALGLAARKGRFCTLGAIEDALYARDFGRARMWAVALGVAILGVAALVAAGRLDVSATVYARTGWRPEASIIGGAMFGYGMALAGNCGYGALARMAGGELRSFVVVIVMGVSAYLALIGPLAWARLALFPVERLEPAEASASIAEAGARLLGAPPWLIAATLGLGVLWLGLRGLALRGLGARRDLALWGGVVGAAVALGWWGTAHLAATGFDAIPVESHSFTAPLGETILYAMTSDGGGMGFSVGSVVGVLIGAFWGAWSKGQFRWEACDDPRELGRQIFGAALMGIGGVIAIGCSVGQGLSAFSTLAWSAPVVTLSVIGGAWLGLKHLIEGGPSLSRAIGGMRPSRSISRDRAR